MAINFPSEAQFPYPAIEYRPTADYMVIQGVSAHKDWNQLTCRQSGGVIADPAPHTT